MLAVLNIDSVSQPLMRQLEADGRLPNLARLRARGTTHRLATVARDFPASVYSTVYTGLPLSEHGLYYPFLWSASEQRIRYVHRLPWPPTIWDRLAAAGSRMLVVDPYESHRPGAVPGVWISGWQFRNRIVMPSHTSAPGYAAVLKRLGRGPAVDEIFGRQSASLLLEMRRALLAAPTRVADLAIEALRRDRFDLAWLGFSAGHIAGHQFWSLEHLSDDDRAEVVREAGDSTLAEVYAAVDTAVGRVLDALPPETDVLAFSALGMGVNTSRSDLLPGMVAAVAGGRRPRPGSRRRALPISSLWRIRAAVPTGARAAVARSLPRDLVLTLTERLETPARDWSNVRAFSVPSDAAGYVRLNLRGRERQGIVAGKDADTVCEELAAGLRTFTDLDGSPAVAEVVRIDGGGNGALPDLVVRWADRGTTRLEGVVSPSFGTVSRHGIGSGRSGNHVDDAWAVVVPSSSTPVPPRDDSELVDVPATVLEHVGVRRDGEPGAPLLSRP